jgi:membrane fusion protein
MPRATLFRPEAVGAGTHSWLGGINFGQPVGFAAITGLMALVALCSLVFVFAASYTRKATVAGQLVPAHGIANVVAQEGGVLRAISVSEGAHVRYGDTLAILDSSHPTVRSSDPHAAMGAQLGERARSMDAEYRAGVARLDAQVRAATQQLASNRADLQLLEAQRETQAASLAVARKAVERMRGLSGLHYVSTLQLEQQEAVVLDRMNEARSLQRQAGEARRQITETTENLRALSAQAAALRASHATNAALLAQESIRNDQEQGAVVTAPVSGVVSAQSVQPGQSVASGQNLMSVLPDGSLLEAHLWVPSRSIGFVRPGASVVIRYQAFPNAKFGRFGGKVTRVSRSVLSEKDLDAMPVQAGTGEHYYRVVVALDRQAVLAYGKEEALRPGMLLDADILMDRRRLADWLVEPLYAARRDYAGR